MIEVSIEAAPKRVFASALAWPGWSRSGRDEEAALEALAAYGPRYRAAIGRPAAGLRIPSGPAQLRVVERLPGSASTEFGVPGAIPDADGRRMTAEDGRKLSAMLRASWRAFDRAAAAAAGIELAKGPRGGGRALDGIVTHVLDAEKAYLHKLGGIHRVAEGIGVEADLAAVRRDATGLLAAVARGEPPPRTPRSGSLWPPRYFVRRSAWHALDHAWEIEDRVGGGG